MSGTAPEPSQRRYSIAHLALIVPWIALVIDAWGRIRDNSFLWHVRAGSVQAGMEEVLTADPFSFTRGGERWLSQSWLIELLYSWLEGLVGLAFVPWMILLVTGLTFLGIGLIAYRWSRSVTGTAYVLILSTILMISFLVPRPVIFSFLLLVITILAWDNPRTRWTLPFLFWIWASSHGSFVIGLAYIGLSLIMRREWRAFSTAIVTGLATLVTAHGLGVAEILIEFMNAGDALSLLTEWRRPTFDSPVVMAFAGGIAFIVIGAYRHLITPKHLLLLVPFLAVGITSLRAIPPVWLALVPLVALSLRDAELGSKRRFGAVSAAIFALVVILMPIPLTESATIDEERFPVAAAQHLDEVRTFHDDRVGGYLIWAKWPDTRVYLDDRAELYGARMREFVEVRSGLVDWQPIFERDQIEQVLMRTSDGLTEELKSAGWTPIYEDDEYVVLRS